MKSFKLVPGLVLVALLSVTSGCAVAGGASESEASDLSANNLPNHVKVYCGSGEAKWEYNPITIAQSLDFDLALALTQAAEHGVTFEPCTESEAASLERSEVAGPAQWLIANVLRFADRTAPWIGKFIEARKLAKASEQALRRSPWVTALLKNKSISIVEATAKDVSELTFVDIKYLYKGKGSLESAHIIFSDKSVGAVHALQMTDYIASPNVGRNADLVRQAVNATHKALPTLDKASVTYEKIGPNGKRTFGNLNEVVLNKGEMIVGLTYNFMCRSEAELDRAMQFAQWRTF